MDKTTRLLTFLSDSLDYFLKKLDGVDRDRYFADRDVRCILDKTINDIVLCVVDLCEECLKENGRGIPDTYKDTVLACHEFLGDVVLAVAPLVKHRNEMVHQYLKVNWQNIVAVKQKLPVVKAFAAKVREKRRLENPTP